MRIMKRDFTNEALQLGCWETLCDEMNMPDAIRDDDNIMIEIQPREWTR